MKGTKQSFNESFEQHPFQWIDQTDESVSLLKWEGYKSVLLIVMLSLAMIANATCKGLTINYLLKFAPPDRPINTLTFFEQVPTLISFTTMSSMCLISLWNGQPLETMFGFNNCIVFYSAVVLHNSLIVSGGFVSAFYRLMCVKSKGHLIKAKTLIICEYVFILIAFVPGVIGPLFYSGIANNLEFCTGNSRPMVRTLLVHQKINQNDINFGLTLTKLSLVFGQCLCLGEMFVYANIYWLLKKENQKPLGLSKIAIKSRTKKNVITLTGQIISFAFEISIPLICELLLTKFGSNANIIEPAGIPIIIIFGTTLIAVAQFLTSPELRRFYFQMPY